MPRLTLKPTRARALIALTCLTLAALAAAPIALSFVPYSSEGFWVHSGNNSMDNHCGLVNSPQHICADWTVGGIVELSCCIDRQHLGSGNVFVCEDLRQF